ncbi:MAG: DUF547 domain-containing protein [Flammeovirgaceae bacterium]
MPPKIIELAQNLLLGVKKGEEVTGIRKALHELDEGALLSFMTNDSSKVAFWLNIYNAFIQLIIKEQPELHRKGKAFFTKKVISIACHEISFDDIEHGILRKRKFKYGLGYIPSFFNNAFVLQHQVSRLDFRIHFALNCGAKSCPPIAFYSPANLEAELEMATAAFLETETTFNKAQNTVYVTKLMLWFLGDFGGRKGILSKLKQYGVIPQDVHPKIRFQAYDWSLALANFV